MEIHYLADHPEFVRTLAEWHYAQWNQLVDNDSVGRRFEVLTARANRRTIPTVFVAVENAELRGSATLEKYDMETRRDLTPWMTDVYVAEPFRRRGIASTLVRRVVREAKELGVHRLHLFTTGPWREQLYTGLGWSVLDRPIYRGVERVVMSIQPQKT
jgi:GNAT superfamily N-acetyltransferase